jgi:arylesterase/paraoxonase
LAVLAPYGWERYLALSEIVANRPGHYTPIDTFKSYEIKFQDEIKNCEDLLLDEDSGMAILSCDPGRDRWNTVMGTFYADENLKSGKLWLYEHTDTQEPNDSIHPLAFKSFPNEDDFHPVGMDLHKKTLFVVNHAQSGSCIEVFQLEVATKTLNHIRTIVHPLLHAPNSIESVGLGRLYVTNDHMFRSRVSPILSKIETFSGLPGGTVVYIDLNEPEAAKVVARVPFANGIAKLNSTTLAVASSSKAGVYLYDVQSDYGLDFKSWFRTPAAVDNLSVDSEGTLLMAGHPSAFDLMKVSKGRPICNPNSDAEAERLACGCTAPSWVSVDCLVTG